MNMSSKNLSIVQKEKIFMEDYAPTVNMLPIHNIIKSHLVLFHHSSEKLCSGVIDSLALRMTETIECFINNSMKEKESPARLVKNY